MKVKTSTAGIGFLAFVVLVGGAFVVRSFLNVATEELPPIEQVVHAYERPVFPIESVRLKIFYITESESAGPEYDEAASSIEELFRPVNRFHQVQFLGKSRLHTELYPESIVVGDVSRGVGEGRFISDEQVENINELLTDRLRQDEQATQFLRISPGEFVVRVFIIEGLNAMGASFGSVVLGREMLESETFEAVTASLVYHQVGHGLGMPHMHRTDSDKEPSHISEGVMGLGRFRPIETNFIDDDILIRMGLLQ